ncbi:Fe(3+) dicitrate transport protein [bacterium A37T11]|nr:Fe(3+) dicitrate transport protein [bacterium A37T11]
MKLKVFSLLCCLLPAIGWAQYSLVGIVRSGLDSAVIRNGTVYLSDNKSITHTDENGQFLFKGIESGNYTVLVRSMGFADAKANVYVRNGNATCELFLYRTVQVLDEVLVEEKKAKFGFAHLKAIEDLGIYEGKKSEVIFPDQLVANLATNNARQVYARVAGLNIWENDNAGIQLSIGGRGLDPNRSSNFNTRQNGCDISADALGYPESYYTPPTEAVSQIQIVRGAASLQYGTQFGGLVNFIMRPPVTDKKIALTIRQTSGSYGFYNTFTSASGTANKLSYYTYFQYKKGNGFRGNADFNAYSGYANIKYQLTTKTKIGFDYTHMNYLAHQPGGLSDDMFKQDPTQSNRYRNWFDVNWNLYALHVDHKFNAANEVNMRVFGLAAHRYTVGFRPNRVATVDLGTEPRDLIRGDFDNWGVEGRYLKRYQILNKPMTLLVGTRFYHGFNHSVQGNGSTGKDADFHFVDPETYIRNDYTFPNRNVSLFAEQIIQLSDQWSVVPGVRYEFINTRAKGFTSDISYDLAGNIISNERLPNSRQNKRDFLLAGLGVSYKPAHTISLYGNLSQNYRSVTFSDMYTTNPSSKIDPNLTDEKGFSLDIGVRSEHTSIYNYDVSAFYLNYDNRIGDSQQSDSDDRIYQFRTNIGQAVIMGIESYGEADVYRLLKPKDERWSAVIFANAALIKSEYRKSAIPGVQGNEVEFVPGINLKSGFRLGYKQVKASFQYTHLSDQYSDATNAIDGGLAAVVGLIPAYTIMDVSMSYEYKRYKLEGSINNVGNAYYYTRRATGYPGPGILPSDNRTFYLTLQVKI